MRKIQHYFRFQFCKRTINFSIVDVISSFSNDIFHFRGHKTHLKEYPQIRKYKANSHSNTETPQKEHLGRTK